MGVVIVLIAGAALARYDLQVGIEYRRGSVLQVMQVPGKDMASRLVVVDLGDRQRAIRTADWMIHATPGASVCVAQRTMLLRRFTRYSLALPGYCGRVPGAPRGLPAGPSVSGAPGG